MSKVSVALTTYNGEKYILKQLKSLISQQRPIDEIIICDDSSTDKTVEIINNFIKENNLTNVHLFVNKKNLGFIKNFKQAIEKTSGDIIFLCDQDDIWYNTKVGAMLNRFESDERIKAICSSFDFIDDSDNILNIHKKIMRSNNNIIRFRVEPFETVKIDIQTICSYNISPGCTLGFTKQVKDIYLSRTKCCCVHDWEIASIAAFLDGLYFFNTPLVHYRIHESNTIGLSELINLSAKTQLIKYDIRLDQAKQIHDYFDAITVYYDLLNENSLNLIKNKANFISKRVEALTEKNVQKLINLYKNNHFIDLISKSCVADLFCIIKK